MRSVIRQCCRPPPKQKQKQVPSLNTLRLRGMHVLVHSIPYPVPTQSGAYLLVFLSQAIGSLSNRPVCSIVCCIPSVLSRQISPKEVLTSTSPFDRCSPFTVERLLLSLLATPPGDAYLIFRSIEVNQVLTSPFSRILTH